MTSLSGTATAPLPAPFSLNIRPVSQRVADRESTSQRSDERARQLAIKRRAKHEIEMLSLEWSRIMTEKTIQAALDPNTDPALAHKMRMDLINRGIGKVREAEDENADAKKKGGNPAEFLEMLAAISTAASAAAILSHNVAPTPRIERDIGSGGTDEDSLQSFLDDLSDEAPDGDDDEQ